MTAPTSAHSDAGTVGIVHIGPGAFHRAHQVAYTQDAMAIENGPWQIEGVSLRSRTVADALNAQNGNFTLVIRGAVDTEYRKMTALAGVLTAADGMDPILNALCRPATRIVSLTVTEKAYTKAKDENGAANSVIQLLTDALQQRRVAGAGPITLLSCDNLSDNGAVLSEAVQASASNVSSALVDWISEHVTFPSTMVDRITPATTPDLIAEVERATGWADAAPVETEAFSQWVIEDNFANGRPQWEAAGALLVSHVAPFEHMKLRMLNGAHSMLAYAGHVAGKTYVRDVMADEPFAELVSRHMQSAAATLDPVPAIDLCVYRKELLERFRNPHIAHETYQIATDGSQKLPQRIFSPAVEAINRGLNPGAFAFATAAWLRYLNGKSDADQPYKIRDPHELVLADLPAEPNARVNALCGLPNLVPPILAASDAFKNSISERLERMNEKGMRAAVMEELHA
ncbi:MAG: mannitol dehydrogenase family protein [Pseudomonadota bacterium]